MVMKLYGASATSSDAIASLDCPEDGSIVGALIVGMGTGLSDASTSRMEVSFASTSGFTSNDTRAAILGGAISYEFTTSGGSTASYSQYVAVDEPVSAGERLYLHINSSSMTGTWTVFLYMDYKAQKSSERRRR